MKWLSIFILLFCFSCKKVGKYQYDLCDFQINAYQNNDTVFNTHQLSINLDDFNFNENHFNEPFYGAFKGISIETQLKFNVLAFHSKFSPNVVQEPPYAIWQSIDIYPKDRCFKFTSSIDLEKYFDKRYPIVIGELELWKKD